MFMTYGSLDQDGEGSAAECRSALTQTQYAIVEGRAELVAQFDLSERQAYRYMEEAADLERPVEVTEATLPITLKLPPSTVERLRKYAQSSGLTIGMIVTAALNSFLRTLRKHG